MKSIKFFKTVGIASVLASALALGPEALAGDHTHHTHDAGTGAAKAENPLVEEMRHLNEVFGKIVSGVALGDGVSVHAAIETMHGAKEKTQEGLKKGEVKLPKNQDRIKEFERLDEEFHSDLESLAKAAHHNDRKEMLSYTKKLLDGCLNCHTAFRK